MLIFRRLDMYALYLMWSTSEDLLLHLRSPTALLTKMTLQLHSQQIALNNLLLALDQLLYRQVNTHISSIHKASLFCCKPHCGTARQFKCILRHSDKCRGSNIGQNRTGMQCRRDNVRVQGRKVPLHLQFEQLAHAITIWPWGEEHSAGASDVDDVPRRLPPKELEEVLGHHQGSFYHDFLLLVSILWHFLNPKIM
jgi:hypothetical protein